MAGQEDASLEELLAWRAAVVSIISDPKQLEEEAKLKFVAYDKDGSNFLDFPEIRAVRPPHLRAVCGFRCDPPVFCVVVFACACACVGVACFRALWAPVSA